MFFFSHTKYFAEEYFCYHHDFDRIENFQFFKKICGGKHSLSLHMYYSFHVFKN